MPYEIYITRAEVYYEDENPITLAEILSLPGPLPKGFSVDKSGIVTSISPQPLIADVGAYLIYEDENDENSRVHIYFSEKNGPWFSVRKEKYMLPIIELADKLQAKVQGEEGEIYTKQSILSIIDSEQPKKRSLIERIFRK